MPGRTWRRCGSTATCRRSSICLPREAKVQRRVLQAVEKDVGGLRFERVYISPRRIAHAAEIDLTAANRALRELSKLRSVRLRAAIPRPRRPHARADEAVRRARHRLRRAAAPQGGRICQARPDGALRHFPRLPAARDSRLLWRSQPAEVRRVRQLPAFDRRAIHWRAGCVSTPITPSCQRRFNVIGRLTPPARQQIEPQVLEAVRIVLSGVARMKGRFGKQMLARMLVGSQGQGRRQVQARQAQHVRPAQHPDRAAGTVADRRAARTAAAACRSKRRRIARSCG